MVESAGLLHLNIYQTNGGRTNLMLIPADFFLRRNMNGGLPAKIRLVRCPKCQQILPELPDIPVYECGGCGTRLQAKIRKSNATSTSSISYDTDSAQIKKLGVDSEDQESGSSSHGVILHSSGECPSHQNNGSNQLISGNCNIHQLSAIDLKNDDETLRCEQNEPGDNEHLVGLNLSNEDKKNECEKYESGDSDCEQLGNANLDNDDKNAMSDQNEFSYCVLEQPGVFSEVCSSPEVAHLDNEELSQIAGEDPEPEAVYACSQLTREEAEVDANIDCNHNFKRSSIEKLVDTKKTVSNTTVHRETGGSISSDILISSPDEQLEEALKSARHSFSYVRSTDTFETTDFVDPSSELSGNLIDLSKSPTTTSARAYYDDGASSYEGMDDQSPGRYKHSHKSFYKPSYYAAFDDRTKREKFQVNRNSEIEHQSKNFAPFGYDKTRRAIRSSKLDQDEVLEPTRQIHMAKNWRRSERDECISHQQPFYRSSFQTGYESGRPSVELQSEFHCNSNFHSHNLCKHSEQEKMKLLRMVYELQDQLNKTCSLNERANERVSTGVTWKDQHNPMHYDPEAIEEESFFNYSRYPGRFRETGSRHQQGKYSRIPFSAEATNCMRQVDHSMCCCPQDRQCPVKLPPSGLHGNKGFCKVHSGINMCCSYSSCPSSPQWHTNSEFTTYYRGIKSGDQKHWENEEKNCYLREKHYSVKRHLRPMAGGAPFITCPRCSKQLQLPADFLLYKRRCHKLQCGFCSELLKFSLLNGTHLVPFTASTVKAPPPSEVGEYTEAVDRRDLARTFCMHNSLHTEPVSCSEDLGLSWCKSCSTDGDPVSDESFHGIQGNAVDRIVTSSLFERGEGRKKLGVHHDSRKKYKNPVQTHDSAGPSSSSMSKTKVSTEIEEHQGGGSSPLHQLMGYPSARDIMFGCGGPSHSGEF